MRGGIGVAEELGVDKQLVAVQNMLLNERCPDPESYTVKADGEVLACEPLTEEPLGQRCFLS